MRAPRGEDDMNVPSTVKPEKIASRSAALSSADRRTKERKRQRLVDGFVSSARTPTPRPCTVCDMSLGGSRIELWGNDAKPLLPGDRITLYIPGDRKEVDAEVRWRKDKTMGLKFTSPFRAPTRRYS